MGIAFSTNIVSMIHNNKHGVESFHAMFIVILFSKYTHIKEKRPNLYYSINQKSHYLIRTELISN